MNDERILDWILVTGGSLQAQRDGRPLDGELAQEIADLRQQQAEGIYVYPAEGAGPTPESSAADRGRHHGRPCDRRSAPRRADRRDRDHTQNPAHQEALRIELAHRLQEKGIPAMAIVNTDPAIPLASPAELRRGIFASLAA